MRLLCILVFNGVFLINLFSCTNKGAAGKKGSPDYETAVRQNPQPAVILDAFKIVDSDGDNDEVGLRMDNEGKCYIGEQLIGIMTAAGELKYDNDEPVASMQGDRLIGEEGKVLGIIKEDGTIMNGSGKDMSWDENGMLTNSESGLKIIPIDTKGKRAASIFLAAFFGFSQVETNPAGIE